MPTTNYLMKVVAKALSEHKSSVSKQKKISFWLVKIEQPFRITTTNVISSEVQLLKVWEIVKFIENKGHSSKAEFWPLFTTFFLVALNITSVTECIFRTTKTEIGLFLKIGKTSTCAWILLLYVLNFLILFFFFFDDAVLTFFLAERNVIWCFFTQIAFFTTTFTFKEWKLHVAYYNSITQKILSAQKLHKKGLHFLLTYYAYCYL